MNRVCARHAAGFSLVEIAVVLVIIAILATAVGIPLAAQLDQQRNANTQKQLELIKEALYGFAMANGRLPCPATATSNGTELGTASTGVCATYSGFVPAVTLGLAPVDANGFMVDGWASPQSLIRYAIPTRDIAAGTPTACTTSSAKVISRTDGIRSATMACLADTAAEVNLLSVVSTTVNSAPNCVPSTLTSKAPFVLFSLGKNVLTGGVGADEAQNLVTTATTFVSHTPTAAGSCAGEFDDIVTWGSLNTLFARMVQAGKLP